MKAYKVEVLILDFENYGADEIKSMVENSRDIDGSVMAIREADIGTWSDDHPLNNRRTATLEFERLFATPPSPSTARDQAAVREGVETTETRMATGFQPLSEGGPNSPGAAQKTDVHPIASDSIRSAPIIADSNSVEFGRIKPPSTAPIAEDERAAFDAWFLESTMYRLDLEDAMWIAWQARAALSSRPAGEVELPPLPRMLHQCHPRARFTADQLRAYGQECARAALASKPAAIDAEEVASVIEGALVEDVLPYHSPEWVARAQALLAKLKS